MPLKLQSTVLTEAYVGGTSLNCLNAIHWYAKKCIGMVTWTVICPLYFPEYGQDTDFVFRQRVKIILNTTNERMRMKIRSIICNLYDYTNTVLLFLVYASQVDRPKMMVLFCMVLLSSYKNND